MSSKIAALPSEVIDQIAAGEVVERPASVVKELLDNALDAGATQVWIDLEEGGIGLIRVVDNGEGIARDDVNLALTRHATSKLRSFEELQTIDTFGFRGEALASIASVSKLTLTTRTREEEIGTQVVLEAGIELSRGEAAHSVGTMIEARELFFNVPARLKFLKSAATESAHVHDIVIRAALAHPNVRMRLRRDGRVVREILPTASKQTRVESLIEAPLALVTGDRDGVHVEAYLSSPEHARTGTAQLHLFVNGRPVRDRGLARAIAFSYGSALHQGQFPVGAVYLAVDPREVDINAHPQKTEVRFSNLRKVMAGLTHVLHEGLAAIRWPRASIAPRANSANNASSASTPPYASNAPLSMPSVESYATTAGMLREVLFLQESEPAQAYETPTVERAAPVERGTYASLHVLATTRHEHAIGENHEGLVVIDLRALDELATLVSLEQESEGGELACKPLLFPSRVALARGAIGNLDRDLRLIRQGGFDVASLGADMIMVHGATPRLDAAHAGAYFEAFFEAISENVRATDEARLSAGLHAMAQAAVRLTSPKKRAEKMRDLIVALDALDKERVKKHRIVRVFPWSEIGGARPERT